MKIVESYLKPATPYLLMFPNFLPRDVNLLEHPDSISLARSIRRTGIGTLLDDKEIETAYVCLGKGSSPLLLLHGFDSSLLEYRHIYSLLAAQRETWAVDLLGFGFTARPNNLTYNPETIKEHLYCFWRKMINRPMVLVASSMGGATAIDFAITYPQAVEKLVLMNSVGYSGSFYMGRLLFEPFDRIGVEFLRQRKIQALFWGKNLGLIDSKIEDVLRCAILPSLMSNWEIAIKDFTRSGGYYDLEHKIHLVTQPTLILWGDRDDVLGTSAAVKFRRAIANSRLIWLPEVGHTPHYEQPEVVARHILNFTM